MSRVWRHDQPAGISLLEVMLSLVVVSILLAMVLRLWPQVSRHQKTNATVKMIAAAQAATDHWQAIPGTAASDLSVQRLIDMGLLDASAARSPWGHAWQLSSAGSAGNIQVVLGGMPQTACRHLAALLAEQLHVMGGCNQARYEGVLQAGGVR